MRVPLFLFRQIATVEVYQGDSAYGPVYGAPVDVRCRIEHSVTRDADLAQQVSKDRIRNTTRAFFPAGTSLPVKSKVTWSGQVFQVKEQTLQAGLTASHVEVVLE